MCVCVCFFSNEADDSTPLLVDARAEIRECHATFRDVWISIRDVVNDQGLRTPPRTWGKGREEGEGRKNLLSKIPSRPRSLIPIWRKKKKRSKERKVSYRCLSRISSFDLGTNVNKLIRWSRWLNTDSLSKVKGRFLLYVEEVQFYLEKCRVKPWIGEGCGLNF